jgi:hypothetical protein
MIQIYNLPSATPYNVTISYRKRNTSGAKYANAATLDNVVFYESTGQIQPGVLGIQYKVQISTSLVDHDPAKGYFTLNGKGYEIIDSKLMKNLAIVSYYQCNVKESKAL